MRTLYMTNRGLVYKRGFIHVPSNKLLLYIFNSCFYKDLLLRYIERTDYTHIYRERERLIILDC